MLNNKIFVLVFSLILPFVFLFNNNSYAYFHNAAIYEDSNNIQYEILLEELIAEKINENNNINIDLIISGNNNYYKNEFKNNLAVYLKNRIYIWTYTFEASQEIYNLLVAKELEVEEVVKRVIEKKLDSIIEESYKYINNEINIFIQQKPEKNELQNEEENIVNSIKGMIKEAKILETAGRNDIEEKLIGLSKKEKIDYLQKNLKQGEIFFFDYLDLVMINEIEEKDIKDNLEKHNLLAYTLPYEFKTQLYDVSEDNLKQNYQDEILSEKVYFLDLAFRESNYKLFEKDITANLEQHLELIAEMDYIKEEDFDDFLIYEVDFKEAELKKELLEIDKERSYIFYTATDYILFLNDVITAIENKYRQENPQILFAILANIPLNSHQSAKEYYFSIKTLEKSELEWLKNEARKYIEQLKQHLVKIENQNIDSSDNNLIEEVLVFMSFFKDILNEKVEEDYNQIRDVFEKLEQRNLL